MKRDMIVHDLRECNMVDRSKMGVNDFIFYFCIFFFKFLIGRKRCLWFN